MFYRQPGIERRRSHTRIRSVLPFLSGLLFLAFPNSFALATPFAASGFNDASGINSNPSPGSPFLLNSPATGFGDGESGWAGTWTGGNNIVENSTIQEGDQAVQVNPISNLSRQLAEPRADHFRITQQVLFGPNSRFVAYTENTPEFPITQGAIWQFLQDHTIRVIDGTGDGADIEPFFVVGNWVSDTWYKVMIDVDMSTKTWDFYLNDVKFNAPHPLGFRGTPDSISWIRYLSEGSSPVFVDAVVVAPEPGGVVMAAMGLIVLITANAWRRAGRHIRSRPLSANAG